MAPPDSDAERPAPDGCPHVAAARAEGGEALERALELARASAHGALLVSRRGRRLDAQEREELLQEAATRLLQGITQTSRPVENLQDWAKATVELLLKERWQRRARDAREGTPLEDAPPPIAVDTPEEQALARERRSRVRACLERLPPHYRNMLNLRYREQLSNAEIAAHVDKTEKAVEQAIPRALRLVRACLEKRSVRP